MGSTVAPASNARKQRFRACALALLAAVALPQAADAGESMSRSAGPGFAQDAQALGPAATVRRMDRDGDGRISREEFRGPAGRFARLDADNDGFVTEDEISAFRTQRSGTEPSNRAPGPLAAWYRNLPVVLTHTHFNVVTERRRDAVPDWSGAETDALRLMDEIGIRAAIVMPTPRPGGRRDDAFFGELVRIA
ncbi:MAG TPA: hypothetical protein VLL72_01590, partial [Kiloniellales bacterium]|nr:hypothetical protein [Kiloniellales bacterium]